MSVRLHDALVRTLILIFSLASRCDDFVTRVTMAALTFWKTGTGWIRIDPASDIQCFGDRSVASSPQPQPQGGRGQSLYLGISEIP
jgi:hypothetical protein